MKTLRNAKLSIAVTMALAPAAAFPYANIYVSSYFPAPYHRAASEALQNMYDNNFSFYTPAGRVLYPYNEAISTISGIERGPGPCQAGSIACTYITPYKGPIWVFDAAFTNYGAGTQPVLMEIFLHEGDHHVVGGHTCGTWADANDDGPYGVTSYYMAKLKWRSTNLDTWERNQAISNATYRAYNNVCNVAARTRILNAVNSNEFCYGYDESGQAICAIGIDPGTPPAAPPPPPSICYYDESGEICYSAS